MNRKQKPPHQHQPELFRTAELLAASRPSTSPNAIALGSLLKSLTEIISTFEGSEKKLIKREMERKQQKSDHYSTKYKAYVVKKIIEGETAEEKFMQGLRKSQKVLEKHLVELNVNIEPKHPEKNLAAIKFVVAVADIMVNRRHSAPEITRHASNMRIRGLVLTEQDKIRPTKDMKFAKMKPLSAIRAVEAFIGELTQRSHTDDATRPKPPGPRRDR